MGSILKAAVKAEAAIRDIEIELETMKCCAELGADFEDADGYARGAMEADKRRRAAEEMTESNNGVAELLDLSLEGNSIIEAGNILGKLSERAATAAGLLVALGTKEARVGAAVESDYAKLSKAKDFLKDIAVNAVNKAKKTIKEAKGIIVNKTSDDICIAGNEWGSKKTTKKWLPPGESSIKYFQDADTVVIMPGQRFFKPYSGVVVTDGAIKIRDWSKTASVTKYAGIYSVNAFLAQHYPTTKLPNPDWKP